MFYIFWNIYIFIYKSIISIYSRICLWENLSMRKIFLWSRENSYDIRSKIFYRFFAYVILFQMRVTALRLSFVSMQKPRMKIVFVPSLYNGTFRPTSSILLWRNLGICTILIIIINRIYSLLYDYRNGMSLLWHANIHTICAYTQRLCWKGSRWSSIDMDMDFRLLSHAYFDR